MLHQKVFRKMAFEPSSSYSALVTHMFLNVALIQEKDGQKRNIEKSSSRATTPPFALANEARIEPPIQHERMRSGGAQILILVSLGANFPTSDSNRSPKPGGFYAGQNENKKESWMFAWLRGSSHFRENMSVNSNFFLLNASIFSVLRLQDIHNLKRT